MPVSLKKGEKVSLNKGNPGLKNLYVGIGWDINKFDTGGSFDLDSAAFLIADNGKVTSSNDFVFFGNLKHPSGAVEHLGDNRTGAGDGDDEVISIDLDAVSPSVSKIVCCVTIDQAIARRQTFGMVNNSYVRLVNKDNGKELCRFELKDNSSTDTAVVFAELVRDNGSWVFHTIGEGKQADLNGIAAMFQ